MRIIGGKHRGRALTEFKGEEIRPTADRVKESLFNILSGEKYGIAGARVLDLFCGSGALGLECLSRGAKEAIFNDCSKNSVAVLRANIKKLGEEERCTVYALDYTACLARLNGKFDIVFIDPPYRYAYGEVAVKALLDRDLLAENGVIVYERTEPFNAADVRITAADVRKYGKTYVTLLQKSNGAEKQTEG
ncbi:MAG: 16S rRNA (guanine(966)-N(2))-methyltransferase RsmD [Candidatus Borkfalkiaceae bacterium]|nr:16S rRNA (guanine(966)-N(2))-methyltransferase RsmD [Clostridia bacterium]MDY6223240.1 16S rRNA (guanine(966)-N(2))-methyltransferase RsmD [Christensenellaceae bacterium]